MIDNPKMELGAQTELGLHRKASFATTQWTVVHNARNDSPTCAERALQSLCKTYWYPLYAFVRRQGFDSHQAEDLTQEFLAWFLQSGHLRTVDPERGKFRSFLLVRLKHFLSDERKKARAQKRGGGQAVLSLDAAAAEERFTLEPFTSASPDKAFDFGWAHTLFNRTVSRLENEYRDAGRAELFNQIRSFRGVDQPDSSYGAIADRLGLSVSAVKSSIYRLRQRLAELLREEIAETVAAPAEVDDELRYLISILTQ